MKVSEFVNEINKTIQEYEKRQENLPLLSPEKIMCSYVIYELEGVIQLAGKIHESK